MELLPIGKIVKAQGIKGEVKVARFSDEPFSHNVLKYVYIDGQRVSVKSFRSRDGFAYIGLSTITDRNQAEMLKNKEVFADKNDIDLPRDRFFIDDILKSKVVFENDEELGVVEEIMQNPRAADVYVVRGKDGEIMFPLLKKIALEINADKKLIRLKKEAFEEVAVFLGSKGEEE